MKKTPAEKWQVAVMNYKKQCQNILKLSGNVRYAGVINAYGRTLTGIIKPNVKPLLKSEEVKNEFFIVSTLISLRQNNEIGKLDYVLLKHSKVNILILHKNNVTFYVSINHKEKNSEQLVSKIKKII
ncbi:MAG: hypothetical protein HOG44_04905 [Nitrosopumilus sp.]|jgi:hypothetical protein|nr:hypothetical protein [Nitrosopumilus sp.]MBT3686324.1 hypothetical protein [Nitrosopumilus sp.]MBT4216617.1 hypothetical protein [Nitrosopumilus sp.]MBT4550903.1 hypothetical protein [Nitrosopumilus sp.]